MSAIRSLRSYVQTAKVSTRVVRPSASGRQCLAAVSQASLTSTRPSHATSRSYRHENFTRATTRSYASAASVSANVAKTKLYDLHLEHGAKMVPFGGFLMPVQYSDQGVGESHKWTREKASLFDVSHMVQYHLTGAGATAFLEKITPSSLQDLPNHQSTLSALLHPENGGICDDMIITRLSPEKFYVVTNAGCREKDYAYLTSALSAWNNTNPTTPITLNELTNQGLIAIQGPLAVSILESLLTDPTSADLSSLYFGHSKFLSLSLPDDGGNKTVNVLASRGGYTGEDGFEISIPPADTAALTAHLLASAGPSKLRLAGLGARDSLRLEAGMCLYGHDLDDSTTPVEAGLSWIVGKSRRATGGFHGAETILPQLVPVSKGGKGVSRRRVGLVVEGAPAREGAKIVDANGEEVGNVTSGCPSPTLGKNIAMGYVRDGLHKAGTEVQVLVRGKPRKATVTKMPFVASKYWKGGISPA